MQFRVGLHRRSGFTEGKLRILRVVFFLHGIFWYWWFHQSPHVNLDYDLKAVKCQAIFGNILALDMYCF